MARKQRSSKLENRTNRLKLPVAKKPVFVRIGEGISLGYRRNQTEGTWVLRIADGKGGASTKAFAHADDHDEADGRSVLTFWQAQERAKELAKSANGQASKKPVTVRMATEAYLEVLTAKNPGTAADTRGRLEKHFLAKFGDKLLTQLTKSQLDSWLASMVAKSSDPERVRKSKDSANRVLTMVKAMLNHALQDPTNGLRDDTAWKLVKPYHGVSQPRDVRYTDDEVKRIIDQCQDKAVASLIKGAILTGARYGEFAKAKISSYDPPQKTLTVSGKNGFRTVILQDAAVRFFEELIEGRGPDEFIFLRSDGTPWKKSDQTRPVKAAIVAAGLSDEGCLYAFRHTYISHAIEQGVPLIVIAENCGTSVRMIEKTYAKVLAEKRREFIERGAPSI